MSDVTGTSKEAEDSNSSSSSSLSNKDADADADVDIGNNDAVIDSFGLLEIEGEGESESETRSDNNQGNTQRASVTHIQDNPTVREGRVAIASFLKNATCYDIIPVSSKVVVFDQSIPLRLSYYALVEHDTEAHSTSSGVASRGDVQAVPVWDPLCQCLTGIITVSDIIEVLKYGHKTNTLKEIMDKHSIASWRSLVSQLRRNPSLVDSLMQANVPGVKAAALQAEAQRNDNSKFICDDDDGQDEEEVISLGPDSTLYEACTMLQNYRIQWIPVLDAASQTCLGVMTHLEVLRYLVSEFREERRLFDQSIKSLGIGTFKFNGEKIISARPDTLLCDIIDSLIENHVSCVPIVDKNNRPITVYSAANITTPTAKSSIDMCMTLPVSYFLNIPTNGLGSGNSSDSEDNNNSIGANATSERVPQLFTCSCDETLQEIFVKFAETQVHRLISVDANGAIDGIVSLSDLLSYFLEREFESI